MIRKLENKDINIIMDIWLKSTIKAHNFIDENYWRKNYNNVKNIYIPISGAESLNVAVAGGICMFYFNK